MSVELRPLGVNCNIACQYCYQNPQRDAGNLNKKYDIEEMKKAILAEGGPFTMFGGEPLMVPKEDLEVLWKWGAERFGMNGIQTNGTLVDEDHLLMFKKYKVHVGISIDGPGELNDVRWAGTLEKTRLATAKTEAIIKRLCDEGNPPNLIITLHKNNATSDKLPVMQEWLRYLDSIGVFSARLHILESDSKYIQEKYALSMEENILAMLAFAQLEDELSLQLDLFSDIERLLTGNDRNVSCVWRACDSYTTPAVRGVEGKGQRSNCGRTNKDGIDFVKSETKGFERYIALYHTPQQYGGCMGCRFFMMCKGQCPGTSIDGDWRNRTEHCDVWMKLFAHAENKLLQKGIEPLSLSRKRIALEHSYLEHWERGENPGISYLHSKLFSNNYKTIEQACK